MVSAAAGLVAIPPTLLTIVKEGAETFETASEDTATVGAAGNPVAVTILVFTIISPPKERLKLISIVPVAVFETELIPIPVPDTKVGTPELSKLILARRVTVLALLLKLN